MGVQGSAARRPRFNSFNTMPGSHFRLITLGGLELARSDGEPDETLAGLNARRRKVALLTVLALSRRSISRDVLVEMFWGDQDEARARHSLSDAVSHLRRVLGRDSIIATRSDIALAPNAPLVTDAVRLADVAGNADGAGEPIGPNSADEILALYSGPFLGGVYVEGSPSFEQWVTRERTRLERLFLRAVRARCKALAEPREHAVYRQALAEQWLEVDPLSAEAAVTYFDALASTDEAVGQVLPAYERLRARLRREYDVEPDPSVSAVVANVKARRQEPVVALRVWPESDAGQVGGPPPTSESDAVSTVLHHPSNAPAINPPPTPRGLRPRAAAGVLALVLTAAAFVVGANRSASSPPPSRNSTVVAIAAIEPAGSDTSLSWLADGLPQMIAAKLSRTTDLEVVPPAQIRAVRLRAGVARRALTTDEVLDLGRRVGATVVVSGAVTGAGANAVLDLDVRALPDGRVHRINVAVAHDILALVDEATVQLLGAIGSTGSGPTLAEIETPSISAYQHFTRYTQIASEGRLSEAIPELDAAIAIDSSFTAALLARLIHAMHQNEHDVVATLNTALRKRGNRVPERDRLEWEARLALLRGEGERGVELARVLVARYPRDTRGYVLLAELYANAGRWNEHARVLDGLLALDSLGMEAGNGVCAACAAFDGVVNARLVLADNDAAERAARRWVTLAPEMPSAWASLARVLAYRQHYDEAVTTMYRAVALSDGEPSSVRQLGSIFVMGRRLESADSLVAAWNASDVPALERHAFDLQAIVERERGQFRASNRTIERAIAAFPDLAFLDLVRGNGLARVGDHDGATQAYEAFHPLGVSESWFRGGHARTFAWHHALLADALAEHADVGMLTAVADSIQRVAARSYYGRDWHLHHHVRGLVAVRKGNLGLAEREFHDARWVAAGGWNRTVLELAKVQLARGRVNDAIGTLREAYSVHPDAMGRYLPRTEIDFWMAIAFRHAGMPDSALVYSRYARRAWSNADPEVKALLSRLDD